MVVTNQLRQRAGTPGQATYTAGGRALGYYASVRLCLDQPQSIIEQDQVVGRRVRVQVVKNKLAPAWQTCELEVHGGHGLSAEASLLDLGLAKGLLTQRGAWVRFGTVPLGRGRQAAGRHLREHPELARRLAADVQNHLSTNTVQPAVAPAAS